MRYIFDFCLFQILETLCVRFFIAYPPMSKDKRFKSMANPVKVLIPVAYDYELSLRTLALVYDHADMIQIAVDRDRLTWSGARFEIPQDYWRAVKAIDKNDKIDVYEDSFFVEGKAPIVLDTLQRIAMAKKAGEGGWHVQLDADEYFIDFGRFVGFLRRCERHYGDTPLDVYVNFISMFKRDDGGFLLAWPPLETYPIATNLPNYRKVRSSHQAGRLCIRADSYILHDTWSRSEEDLAKKLTSWGHVNDFNVNKYIKFWRSVDGSNYIYIRNFHPINPGLWRRLLRIAGSLDEVIKAAPMELASCKKGSVAALVPLGEDKYFLLPAKVQLFISAFKRFMAIVRSSFRRQP